MSKRKANGETNPKPTSLPNPTKMDLDDDDSGSDSSTDLLNVDFEYFDPSPNTDFHGLKTLLRQLFDIDNTLFDLSELTDLILSQPLLGSTVKCDGAESDPYAFLTVLNMHENRTKKCLEQVRRYVLARTKVHGALQSLSELLDEGGEKQIGLVLSERFINMPAQVVPPMYNMLLEEMRWANEEKEPYAFTHYLVLSKTYTEVASELDAEESRPSKKVKAKGRKDGGEVFYFHPEDEVLRKHAIGTCSFEYENAGEGDGASDSKRVFQELGVKPQGLLILIERSRLEGAVKAVGEYLGAETET